MPNPILSDGIELIKHCEGLKLTAYQDSGNIWTIGYGHTEGVKKGQVITKTMADMFLIEDIADSLKDLNQYVKVPINAFQKAALSSFVFNMGGTKFSKSTLLKLLNEERYASVAEQFRRWIYGKNDKGETIILPGLVKRREAERKLFLGFTWEEIKKEVYK